MSKTTNARIMQKNDIAFNWAKAINFTPKRGEVIVYNPDVDTYGPTTSVDADGNSFTYESSTKVRLKIGDGTTNVNLLPFINTEAMSEIYIGTERPTDENIKIWINPDAISSGSGSAGTIIGEISAENVKYSTEGSFVHQEGFDGTLDDAIIDITSAISNNYVYTQEALYNINEYINPTIYDNHDPRISALETYVYDNDDEVLGLKVNFVSNEFTRLCGAKGLLPGEDFNKYRMYGQRRRCNVDDDGNILNFLGDETPTYYRLKLYEGKLPTTGKTTTITTPLYYVMRQQGSTVMPIPGVGAFFVGFDGKEPTMVTLKPGEKTSVSDGVSATAGGSYDSTNNVSYYDGTFTLTTEGNFPSNVKVIVVFQSGYSEDGFHGQVMVYQPKFYYKIVPEEMNETDSTIADVVRYYISDRPLSGFKLHPAFYDKNGNEVDYILLSAYEGGLWSNQHGPIMDAIDWSGDADVSSRLDTNYDTLLSIANIQPISGESRSLNKNNCEALAQNRGEGWHIENIKTLSANQLLMIIEYGQMNMQKAIGVGPTKLFGYDSRNGSLMTGSTASLGNKTGSASQSMRINPGTASFETLSLPGEVSISYRGLENPWGNIYKFVDGIYYNNADVYICSKLSDSEYVNTGLVMTKELNGYISRFKYSKDYDWLFIPAKDGGANNLPVGDTISSGTWGIQTFLNGGTYWADREQPEGFNTCGPFKSWITRDDEVTLRGSDMGARLIYIPTANTEEV